MGNCQAAEAATVLIQHPGNKVEKIYWTVSANEVMSNNPGHYVALVINSPTAARSENGTPVKQLKLLRPDDTLLMGQVYRLISFEDVLKEFAAKKSVKLGKRLEGGGLALEKKKLSGCPGQHRNQKPASCSSIQGYRPSSGSSGSSSTGKGVVGRHHHYHHRVHHLGGGQWRPALQSIAEVGT
ncbi:hypothetical protein NMG60_11025947 [Bertholletia excelsa]